MVERSLGESDPGDEGSSAESGEDSGIVPALGVRLCDPAPAGPGGTDGSIGGDSFMDASERGGTLGSDGCGTRYSSGGASSTSDVVKTTSPFPTITRSSELAVSDESDGGSGTRDPRLSNVPDGLDGGELATLDSPPTTLGVK
jgi:hypothetical protein